MVTPMIDEQPRTTDPARVAAVLEEIRALAEQLKQVNDSDVALEIRRKLQKKMEELET